MIVGDISGHGPDALEGTNSVRGQLHALLETGMTPRAAIAMVGERAPVQLAGRFSTVVVAVHDPADSTLTFATAGHAPPVVAGPGAEELLSAGASPPIGVELRTGLRETTVTLPPGTTCCFYTDGIVEAKNGEGMIGRGRLEELVSELDPDEQADVLLERVIAEAHDASDDMTLCLIRPLYGARPARRGSRSWSSTPTTWTAASRRASSTRAACRRTTCRRPSSLHTRSCPRTAWRSSRWRSPTVWRGPACCRSRRRPRRPPPPSRT